MNASHMPLLTQVLENASTRPLTAEELTEVNEKIPGLDPHLGLVYDFIGPNRIEAHLEVDECHLQPFGLVNGGVFASIAESTGTIMAILAAKKICVGINNSTDFIKSVRSGTIDAVAMPVHVGRSTQIIDIIMTQDGKNVARTRLRTLALVGQD